MCLYVVKKKICNFPDKSELPKFILTVKISWLNFFCSFWDGNRGGNEKFAEIRAGSLSHRVGLLLNFMLATMSHTLTCILQHEPAGRLALVSVSFTAPAL